MIKVEASYPIDHLDGERENVTRRHYVKASDIIIKDSHMLVKLNNATAWYTVTPDMNISFEEVLNEESLYTS